MLSTGPRSKLIQEEYGDRPASEISFTTSSRLDHELGNAAGARSRRRYTPVEASAENANTLYAGELEIRLGEGLVLATGRALTLSVREFELLAAMARRAGAVVTRDELYSAVWGGELRDGDRSVDVYVSKLRGKLEAAMPDRRFIHTHPGFGYRFQPRAFTKCSHRGIRRLRDLPRSTGPARARMAPPSSSNPARGDVVIKNKIGALGGVVVLALGLAACGSSSSSVQLVEFEQPAHRRHDLRRRLDVRRPGLRTVGLIASPA